MRNGHTLYLEVGPADLENLQRLFHGVVDNEQDVDTLAGHDEVVEHRHVADELDRAEGTAGDGAARGGEFVEEGDHAE